MSHTYSLFDPASDLSVLHAMSSAELNRHSCVARTAGSRLPSLDDVAVDSFAAVFAGTARNLFFWLANWSTKEALWLPHVRPVSVSEYQLSIVVDDSSNHKHIQLILEPVCQ
jgi:hypothetical protein